MDSNPQELSYGEKLVGVKFNPSQNPEVDQVKALCAQVIDLIRNRAVLTGGVQETLINRATNDLLEAQMMAVKALTWTD